MLRNKKTFLLVAVLSLIAVSVLKISAQSADKASVSVRKIDKQVVLYTVVRGGYDKTGIEIGKLYSWAAAKKIIPNDNMYFVYLNNPHKTTPQHYLTEIRIPVSAEALQYAGTFDNMTDVKEVPAMEVAVIVKPPGTADPSYIYRDLQHWIAENGYLNEAGPMERFLTNAQSGNYEQMKSEIMIPITKITSEKK